MKIKLENVRLAFPVLFKPEQFQGTGDPMFSASFLIKSDDPQVKEVSEAIEKVAKEKWPKDWQSVMKIAKAKDLNCLHDGDLKAKFDGFQGHMYVSSRNAARPTVIDRDKSPLTAQDGRPYAGCFVNASIELWAQDNAYGQRINASLRGVQFFKDGDAFAGGDVADADEFDEVDEEDALV